MSAIIPAAGVGMDILSKLLTIAASPGGLTILQHLAEEHGLTQDKLDAVIAGLKEPPPPRVQ